MKKIRAFILALVAATAAMAPLSSCSSDDNDDNNNGGGNTELPKYAALAAQYIIDDEQAAVRSIELTESGRYLVEMSPSYSGAPKRAAGDDNGMYYGTYTTGEDNMTFTLEGFGTLKLNDDGTITITQDKSGRTWKYRVTITKSKNLSSVELRLCRTWTVKSIRWRIKEEGKAVCDITASTLPELYTKVKDLMDDEEKPHWDSTIDWAKENQPQEYTFTGTGLLLVKSTKNKLLDYRRWRMKSGKEMQVWRPGEDDYNDNGIPDENEWSHCLFEYSEEGSIIVSFTGNKLIINNTEDEYGTENSMEYTFEEAK